MEWAGGRRKGSGVEGRMGGIEAVKRWVLVGWMSKGRGAGGRENRKKNRKKI